VRAATKCGPARSHCALRRRSFATNGPSDRDIMTT
jgi:hypothetical protein